jgi:hypothetical protein
VRVRHKNKQETHPPPHPPPPPQSQPTPTPKGPGQSLRRHGCMLVRMHLKMLASTIQISNNNPTPAAHDTHQVPAHEPGELSHQNPPSPEPQGGV